MFEVDVAVADDELNPGAPFVVASRVLFVPESTLYLLRLCFVFFAFFRFVALVSFDDDDGETGTGVDMFVDEFVEYAIEGGVNDIVDELSVCAGE